MRPSLGGGSKVPSRNLPGLDFGCRTGFQRSSCGCGRVRLQPQETLDSLGLVLFSVHSGAAVSVVVVVVVVFLDLVDSVRVNRVEKKVSVPWKGLTASG